MMDRPMGYLTAPPRFREFALSAKKPQFGSVVRSSAAPRTPVPGLRVHLTNVTALGPVQVAESLLPALEACPDVELTDLYLPTRGPLAGYRRTTPGPAPRYYGRSLPSPLSRALECTLLARRYDGPSPILVLGDLPLACRAPQAVFVQTAHVLGLEGPTDAGSSARNRVSQRLFQMNAPWVSLFVVQTERMAEGLFEVYPPARGRTVVVPQPPPTWLARAGLRRTGRKHPDASRLDLVYPAADYPHKNHRLLSNLGGGQGEAWPVEQLTLTIPPAQNPNPAAGWIRCAGLLTSEELLARYDTADALIYLSESESYGLPLVEAMSVGLPIVAPDLPYARVLCGSGAIYFSPGDVDSLRRAVVDLHRRLGTGWWPDWADRLSRLPPDWAAVAETMTAAIRAIRP
jgi:hypothetical protein